MKSFFKTILAALAVFLSSTPSAAQTINIGPNQYAFQFTGNPNFGLFFNQTDGRYEFLNSSADPVIGFNANTGNFTMDLGFELGSDLVIGNNRYAFRSAFNPNFGLFFNAASTEYQLMDGSASPVFAVNANTGNSVLSGGLRIGNSSLNQAGNIRWNGSDFQGYTGSAWATLTGGSVGRPARPQGPQGDSFWTENEGLLSTTQKVAIGTNTIQDEFDFRIDGDIFLNTQEGSLFMGSPITGNQWEIKSSAFTNELWFASKMSGASSFNIKFRLSEEGDFDIAKDLQVDGKAVIDNSLNVLGTSQFFDKIIAQAQIFVQPSDIDSVGVQLNNAGNYFSSGSWSFGDSDGAGPAIVNDFVMSAFGVQEYIFWQSYFKPVQDNQHLLGTSDGRWSLIYASNGTINTSDAREKKNIKELDYGLETLMKMKPVSYEWKEDNANMGTKLGFVAQDLLELLPEVVVTEQAVENRETGEVTYQEAERMGVFYDDLIPVLTKAIQEQQGTIEEQHESIDELVSNVEKLTSENAQLKDALSEVLSRIEYVEQDLQTCCFSSQSGVQTGSENSSTEAAELGQNIPNPFSESTIIRYYLPDGTTNAIIRITDMGGSPVKDLQLGATRGANQVEFQTQGLAAGTYLYSLFVDGKFIDTKKMMIAK